MNFDNWGDSPLYSGGVPAITAPQVNVPKPGAFSPGGNAWKIMGLIGDAMQVGTGGHGTYMPAMLDLQQKVDEERKTQAALAQQAQAYTGMGATPAEIKFLQSGGKWSDIHPAMGEFERTLQASGIQPGTPEWQKNMATRRDNMLDPIVSINTPEGLITAPRSQVGGVGAPKTAPVPAMAVAQLVRNPTTAAQFDEAAKQGGWGITAAEILGGPTQPASGGFR